MVQCWVRDDINCIYLSFFLVYLYGFAAKQDYRRSVPQIRSGEYEGLSEKVGVVELLLIMVFNFSSLIFSPKFLIVN